LDLQETNRKITQYQSYSKECPQCGYENHDNSYPNFVAPHVSYGKNIMAIVVYLNVVHYVSYKRIVQTLQTLYKINISEGTVDSLLKKASKLSKPEINKIVSQLEVSDIVGIFQTTLRDSVSLHDETGAKVNGNRDWYWVFQNDNCTYIVHNKSRGTKVIDEHFPDGFVNAIVGHDNYSSYNSLIAIGEQLCLAHKLRDLNYAIECDDTQVMKDLKILLKEAMIDHKENLLQSQREILKEQYLLMFDKLLEVEAIPKSETQKQLNSLKKARDKIFTFLLYPNVPPDNNGSERAIRNLKVKLKVSQQFKSPQGAKNYATLRSAIDTARKRDMNEFETIRDIVGGGSVF
jgi:transposase-like protein